MYHNMHIFKHKHVSDCSQSNNCDAQKAQSFGDLEQNVERYDPSLPY